MRFLIHTLAVMGLFVQSVCACGLICAAKAPEKPTQDADCQACCCCCSSKETKGCCDEPTAPGPAKEKGACGDCDCECVVIPNLAIPVEASRKPLPIFAATLDMLSSAPAEYVAFHFHAWGLEATGPPFYPGANARQAFLCTWLN